MRRFPASPITSLVDETPLYNLGESVCRDLSVGELVGEGGAPRLEQLALSYGPSLGNRELRAGLATAIGVGEDEVLVTAGAASALFLLSLIFADREAEVVVAKPCFPPFVAALRGIEANVVTVRLRFADSYRLDLDEVSAKLSNKTRLVAVASPQNPAAVAIPRRQLEQLLQIMSTVCPEAFLVVDETYREAVYGYAAVAQSAASLSPRVITCGSFSKAHGAPGLRIGWLTTRVPELHEQLRLAKFNTSISCGAVDEFLALQLLQRADSVLAARRSFLTQTMMIVEDWVGANRHQLSWIKPDAGAFCCIQLNESDFGPAQVRRFYARLAESRVLVARGEWFGDSPHVFRVGFGYEPIEKLQAGLRLISEAANAERAARPSSGESDDPPLYRET